ncbi:MAG: hypothetical protein ABFS46_03985 [Myxococcota bacterium]
MHAPSGSSHSIEPPRPDPRRARAALTLLLGLLGIVPGCRPGDGYVNEKWLAGRQHDYLRFATAEPLRPGSLGNVLAHLEREARDPRYRVAPGSIPDDAWDGIFDKIWRLRDTSDFDVLRLIDLLYAFRGHPAASEALWQRAEEAVTSFKFWYSDPTPERMADGQPVVDQMWYWTENHILIFRTCEVLAGQRFPDRVFPVTGLRGWEHSARARRAILDWLEERARFGFTEWHSNVYYNLDMRPLLSLVEWVDDPVIEKRAAMVLDLVLLDTALHLHRGTFGASHGRSYIKDKASADTEDTFDASKLLFDDTVLPYPSVSSTSGAVFARAKRYRLPEVIRRIARSNTPMVDRQRMNLPLDEVPPADPENTPPPEAPFGWDYRDETYLPFWWSMGSQSVWMMLPLTVEVADRENLWDAQFEPFADLRFLIGNPPDLVFAQKLIAGLWPLINQSLLKEVNTYTYRTEHYMLSTAQDYRKGVRGSQTHTWQATLDERAMVFTQHPSYLPVAPGAAVPEDWNWQQRDEPGPGYWTGESSQPRAAQFENVVLTLYDPQYRRLPALGFDYRAETHAYFPHAHFDEVVQEGPWTFGRRGDAYVALYSWRPTEWRLGQPEVFRNGGQDFDLVATGGADNVWIVELGSREEWPEGFAAFRAAIGASAVDVREAPVGFAVAYPSPTRGTVELSWEGPLRVDGEPQALDGYPRMDNPFAQVGFDETRYEIDDGEYGLVLDFERDEREVSAPRPGPGQRWRIAEIRAALLELLRSRKR